MRSPSHKDSKDSKKPQPFQKFHKDNNNKKAEKRSDSREDKKTHDWRRDSDNSMDSGKSKPFRKSYKDNQKADKPFGKANKRFDKREEKEGRDWKKDSKFSKDSGKPHPFQKFYKDNKKSENRFDKEDDKKERDWKKPERPKNNRKFEEEDLSFGRKKKLAAAPKVKPEEEEITFSKELEDKWTEKPAKSAIFQAKGERNAKGGDNQKPRHAHKRKTIERYMDDEGDFEKAYSHHSDGKKSGQDDRNYYSAPAEGEAMPLNKFIAHCDVCGRREAAQLVREGKVKVNGELITEPGHKVTVKDQVSLSGKKLQLQENQIYVLMNKPKGFITTTDDPKDRRTVMDLVANQIDERIYPVGRLDRNTTGLLLLTNDGQLAQKLSHPSHEIKKVYQVVLDRPVLEADFTKIKNGVVLDDGPAPVNQLAYLETKNEIGLEIHNGRNRIVRRIFESLGYTVEKLDRVVYAGLTKKNIPRGKWRFLSKQEVINLKHLR